MGQSEGRIPLEIALPDIYGIEGELETLALGRSLIGGDDGHFIIGRQRFVRYKQVRNPAVEIFRGE